MIAGSGQRSDLGSRAARSPWAGLLVVAATTTVVLPVATGASWQLQVVGATILAVLTLTAMWAEVSAAIRAVIFLDVVFVVFAGGAALGLPPAVTTVLVCVLPLTVLLICGRTAGLRPAAPWLQVGRRPTRGIIVLAIATVVFAGVALVVWTLITEPPAPVYLRDLQSVPWWLAAVGVVAFALVNPIWEEVMFRGVVLEELTTTWSAPTAVVVQAVLFGVAHWAGFPSGWAGALTAATWGLALGIIRIRSGGILATYAVHVTADAVIGILAISLLK